MKAGSLPIVWLVVALVCNIESSTVVCKENAMKEEIVA